MKNTQRPSIPMRTAIVLALAAVGALGAPAWAVVVDEFSTNQATITQPPGGATTATTAGSDIVGLKRGLTARLRDGAGPMTTGVASGKLSMVVPDTTPNSRGEAVATWDGDNLPLTLSPTGLLGVDVTASDHTAFAFTVLSATAGSELVLEVHSNAGNASRGFLRLPAVAASTVFFLSYSSDFVPFRGAGADFTDVGAIVLTVRGTEATVEVDKVETVAAALTVTKTDLTLLDAEIGGTQQPPGTTFKYRVTITNTGGEALQLDLNDTIDANTTLSAATVKAGIAAIGDAYETPGNVQKVVGALEGLLANDIDPDQNGGGTELTVDTAGSPLATTLGGSVALSSDGSFTYTPPIGVGFAVDTFSYTVNDNDGQSATATAKIYLKRTVWFVDDDADVTAGADGTGTFTDPFDALTQLSGVGGIDGADDLIFVHAGTYASGVVLDSGQDLIGEGSGLQIDLDTFVAVGTAPTITAAGNGVTLNSNNTLMGFTVGDTPAASFDIAGTSFGTLIVGNVTLNGTGGALDLATGTLAAVFNSVTSTSSQRGIRLNAATGSLDTGSTTISNATVEAIEVTNGGSTYDFGPVSITASAAGIDLATSATSTFIFDSLAVTTTNGFGLKAATAGTLNISGTTNVLNATGGEAIDLTSTSLGTGATFSIVTSSGSPGKGINLDGVTGSFSATGGSIGTATGIAVDVNAGTGAISYAGGITNAAARAVEITGRTTSTVTLSGNISDGGTGVNIASNSGGTITLSGTYNGTAASSQIDVGSNSGTAVVNFTGSSKVLSTGTNNAIDVTSNGSANVNFTGGGLVVTTTSGVGFNATGGAGGVTVQGTGNTLSSTTGTALNVASTPIGASGLTFQSISGNGGTNGIVLSSTGASAGLTVTGTGSAGTGGTIQNKAIGISLTSTNSPSFSWMQLNDFSDFAIRGNTVTNFTLNRSVVSGANGNSAPAKEGSVIFDNLFGNATVSHSTISGGVEDNLRVENTSGTLTSLAVSGSGGTGSSCQILNNNTSTGNIGIRLAAFNSANMTVSISNCLFRGNRTDTINIDAANTSTLVSTVTNNYILAGTAGNNQGNLGINVTSGATGSHTTTVSGNFVGTDGVTPAALLNTGINLFSGNASLLIATVTNNTVRNAGTGSGHGIQVFQDLTSTLRVNVDGNTVSNVALDFGLRVEAAGDPAAVTPAGSLQAGVTNNNVTVLSTALDAIRVRSRRTTTLCSDIRLNTTNAGGAGFFGLFTNQSNTSTFSVEGLALGAQTAATTQTYLIGQNPAAATVSATAVTNYTGVASNSCSIP